MADDGPAVDAAGKYGTSQLLASLAAGNFKATFYIVGSNAVQFPNILTQIDAAGHELALHTWTHHPLTALTTEQIVAELKYNEAIIYQATKKSPKTFRPPYGSFFINLKATSMIGLEL